MPQVASFPSPFDNIKGSPGSQDAAEEELVRAYLLPEDTGPYNHAPALAATQAALSSPPLSGRGGKTFVVFNGREVGLFNDWNTVAVHVNKFPGARHASYPTVAEAQKAWADAKRQNLIGPGSSGTVSQSAVLTTPRNNTHNPPPYSKPKTPARQEGLSLIETPIKVEEITPRLPCTGSRPPTGTNLAFNPHPPAASPLAGYSRPPTTDVLMSYQWDYDSWWVVTVGNEPGVYRGKSQALERAGQEDKVKIEECHNSRDEACQRFVDLFAARCICRLGRIPVSSYQPTVLLPVTPVVNDDSWYIVPKGPHPGIYKRRKMAVRMAGPTAQYMFRCESERSACHGFVELYMALKIQEN